MSGETAGLLGSAAGRSGRSAPGTCAGPASAPSSPSAPEPEAASWADGGPPSPAFCPWRHSDPEFIREITVHGSIDPERTHPAGG